jgi:hypothetical protein
MIETEIDGIETKKTVHTKYQKTKMLVFEKIKQD